MSHPHVILKLVVESTEAYGDVFKHSDNFVQQFHFRLPQFG